MGFVWLQPIAEPENTSCKTKTDILVKDVTPNKKILNITSAIQMNLSPMSNQDKLMKRINLNHNILPHHQMFSISFRKQTLVLF